MVIYGIYRHGGQLENAWNMTNKEMYNTLEEAEKWLIDNGYTKHDIDNLGVYYDLEFGMWDEWEGARIQEFYLHHICPAIPDRIIDNGIGC